MISAADMTDASAAHHNLVPRRAVRHPMAICRLNLFMRSPFIG